MSGGAIEAPIISAGPLEAIPDAGEGQWWVAHTRARNEKALARDLERLEIVHYLPLCRRVTCSRRTGRRSYSTAPLFTGYLFFSAAETQRYRVMATNRVARTLFVPDQQGLLAQLRHVHTLLASDQRFEHVHQLAVGRWVRVVAGPLRGVEGCVARRLARARLALNVDILGQAVIVEVDSELLETIDGPSFAEEQAVGG